MNRVPLLTTWKGTGTAADPYRPALIDDHRLLPAEAMRDITGQPGGNLPPSPNVHIIEVTCSDATLKAISNDPKYGLGILQTSIQKRDAATHAKISTHLTNNLRLTPAQIQAALGSPTDNITQAQSTNNLINWAKQLPRQPLTPKPTPSPTQPPAPSPTTQPT